MTYNNWTFLIGFLFVLQISNAAVTKEQQIIYSENPHLVQKAGDALSDPKAREEFIQAMKKAGDFTYKAALGCGVLALGCVVMLARASGTKGKVASLVTAAVFSGLAVFLNQVSKIQEQMAINQETIQAESAFVASDDIKRINVPDGIHF